ncbi:argininosuccinate lyase [Panacibacter ginsenosidivorans]|uniref:Argininosuccinate lyase n=1 Tax=Panacibacter ginsenosidivorans TaxID=1813871 RepID=A0A5B8VBG3_9BACT|nr:argininosuccinate lyase [Panacibacter ginsenosidivorans]QEC68261.1 argininosuccinate lyase [Panacibacter ginsenosidivorans]
MKLWAKNTASLKEVEQFTVGKDREFDLLLAPFDVLGNIAHAKMLATVGLLTIDEAELLTKELREIYKSTQDSTFKIHDNIEDVHSQVEFLLTEKLGDVGKKIHSARSRNDQVLVDVKLFLRSELEKTVQSVQSFFDLLITQSEKFKTHLLPGYTHLQLAMPSSFGLWFGAYAESLVDDTITLKAAFDIVNKNPLGSAAGYGSSFPINRTLTTKLLGFADLNYNVVYAQMGRGKAERIVAYALSNIADTLSKLSMDACLFLNQNFSFVSFPTQLTTGSSIMPHKKNPDVFELIRSHCNRIKALPNEIMMMTTNLPSGYHRDLQLLKEHLFPAFETLRNCIDMAGLMLSNMEVKENILEDDKYKFLFSVEEVNKLVLQGTPFRDAYKKIGLDIEAGNYTYSTNVNHTHEGSIGNLCNEQIAANMKKIMSSFTFENYHNAIDHLLGK